MARKSASSDAVKAGGEPRRQRSRKDLVAPSKELVEYETPLAKQEDKKSKRNKRAPPDSTDAQVHAATIRCITHNFNMFSDEEVYHTRHNGKTLFEAILEAKSMHNRRHPDTPKFGKKLYAEWRARFGRGLA